MGLSTLARRATTAGVSGFVVAGALLGSSSSVSAAVQGCTRGPGTSQACVSIMDPPVPGIKKDGLYVWASQISMNQTVQVWTSICDYAGQWTGTRKNGNSWSRETQTQRHCSSWRAWLDTSVKLEFKDGSNFCGAFKADVTGNKFISPACLKIKK